MEDILKEMFWFKSIHVSSYRDYLMIMQKQKHTLYSTITCHMTWTLCKVVIETQNIEMSLDKLICNIWMDDVWMKIKCTKITRQISRYILINSN